jgi:hypothetical protein
MPKFRVTAARVVVCATLLLLALLVSQVAVTLAAGAPEVYAQVPTPTPFRFLTPTPFVPGATSPTTTTTVPRAGGFPVELALPVLAGGLAAIGGGTFLFRRRPTR